MQPLAYLRKITEFFSPTKTLMWVGGLVIVNAATAAEIKPFRLGVIKLNSAIDQTKPLAVADSGGYIIKGELVIGGFNKDFLTAWNYKFRHRAWWMPLDGELSSPILTIENNGFLGSRGGKIYSFNLTTGVPNWEVELDSHVERPLIFNDGKIYAISVGQVAYAIDAISGKRLWVFDAGFPDNITVKRPPAPIVTDGKLVFAVSSGDLIGVKIDDGKIAWKYNPMYVNSRFHDPVGEMSLNNGKLIFTRYDGLIAQVDMGDNRKMNWQATTASISTSAYRSGKVFTGLVGGDVVAYDATNGRQLWRANCGATPSFIVVGETSVFAIGTDGRVIALELAEGQVLWTDDLGGIIASAPIVTEDRMYISTGLRNIYGYKL
ncbi:MAG: PQQ-binding-like beta-propeller repeat protein [Proteobacteria bacterium]|nr:PQQ-binding-like beta-propeller repeat protein [Pseudomonadota bacterium]